ncbi:hypothetical protein [Draconibacterium orientale]|uniref:hypothetical protein n=1 Tax=Draconibacterium orientale TaxID=1168034 RepID=UPI002A0A6A5C|nr:hypothetical protein [Draconibacterium orientale]
MNILIAIAAFCFMEFVAWSNHKFVMHGFLWKWHRDHHVNDHKKNAPQTELYKPGFEKNDYFFLVYAIPAIVVLILGFFFHISALIALGIGISLYGLTYFAIHDVMIHQRLNIPFLTHTKNKYLRAVREAHLAHHRGKNVRDFDNYGLLIFQFRFLKK